MINTTKIEREDLSYFIAASMATTGQDEYYTGAAEQRVSLAFLHEYIAVNYRPFYAAMLAQPINHFAKRMIIAFLLCHHNKNEAEKQLEAKLIAKTLDRLPAPQAYKALHLCIRKGVNNRRFRAIVERFLATRPDFALHVLKYRKYVKALVRHCHLKYDEETQAILFQKRQSWTGFETPLYETYRKAFYSLQDALKLPFTLAEGFASRFDLDRKTFLKRAEDTMTANEKQRLMSAMTEAGLSSLDQLQKMDLNRLWLYILSLPKAKREEQRDALTTALTRAMDKAGARLELPKGKISVIVDTSQSARNSRERKNHPMAVGLGVAALIQHLVPDAQILTTSKSHATSLLDMKPEGPTNLVTPLFQALERGSDFILLISDGYENTPVDGVKAVLGAYTKIKPKTQAFLHLNPVYDPESYMVKALAPDHMNSVGIRDIAGLGFALRMARFVEGSLSYTELLAQLAVDAHYWVEGRHHA